MPRESQNCLHSPEMAPPAGQCQPAGIWVEFGPSCSGRCLRLDSSSVAGSPAAAVQPEAAGNRAALFWDCDGAPGRLAAAEISAPLVDVLFAFPPMIRQSSNHHTKFRTTDGASECLNSSCGFAKVGTGHKQSILQPLDTTAFILAVTHTTQPVVIFL